LTPKGWVARGGEEKSKKGFHGGGQEHLKAKSISEKNVKGRAAEEKEAGQSISLLIIRETDGKGRPRKFEREYAKRKGHKIVNKHRR